jgi:tripartite-type tricarboxylate transporter receptor subunit TctC
VRADSDWKTFAEFIDHARANPGRITFGSSGTYGTMHVPMEMLKASAGFSITHIPYTGAGPAVAALLGGQVDALSTGPASVVAHIKAGKLRALAHWSEKPLSALPEVPSLKSLGQPVAFAQWSALFVPAATPEPIVQKLRAAARKVAADPAVVQTINRAGSPIEYLDAPDFQAYWDADAKVMTEAVRRIGKVE